MIYLLIALTTTAFLYVMPSNAAFVAGIGLLCVRNKRLVLSLGAGCLLAALLYAPLIPGMLADPQMQAHDSRMRILTESIPEAANAFVSYRWLLMPVIILGIVRSRSRLFWWTACITAMALILFILDGAYLWARVLFPLLPLWCLVSAEAIESIINARKI